MTRSWQFKEYEMSEDASHQLIDVEVAKGSGVAIGCEELIEGVDVGHVVEGTEGEVMRNPGGAIHEALDSLHEVPDLTFITLSTSTEVLAGKLGRPDGKVESVVHILEVLNHLLGVGAVEVDSKTIDSATLASSKEVLLPLLAGGGVGASRGDESVTLSFERLNMLLPELSSTLRRHVGLSSLVRSMEAVNISLPCSDQIISLTH
jgi:hypothetical protein